MDRFCLPSQADTLGYLLKSFTSINSQKVFADFDRTWWVILLSIAISFACAFIFSYFLEKCAVFVFFFILAGFFVGVSALSYFSWT
jgi:hypothetical protein